MTHRPLYAVALSLFFGLSLTAQDPITVRSRPYIAPAGEQSFRLELKRYLPSLRYRLPLPAAYTLPPLTQKELAEPAAAEGERPYPTRAGIHRALESRALFSGRWHTLDNGSKMWRMAIQSPGAAGIRLHLTSFDIGRGRLWLHDGTGQENEIMGPYTGRGLYDSGEFWTDFVLSESIVVEYEPEGDEEKLPFEISEVSHMFGGIVPGIGYSSDTPYMGASCNLDISCYPEWAETAKSVGHLVYESRGNTYFCSGTLLAARNGGNVPYFLTADHCIADDAEARTIQAYWFYQTARCNGPAVTRTQAQRTLGAKYLVSGAIAQGDFSLIQMNSVPNGVTLSGWSNTEVPMGGPLVGIHHPRGDYKRFSRGTRVQTRSGLPGANLARYLSPSFTEGLVEPGSSGSGLFSAPGVLVGNLSSGPKTDTAEQACAIKPFAANYGALAAYYSALAPYLDGRGNPGGTTPPPNNPPPPPGGGGGNNLTSGVPANFTLEAVSAPTLFGGDNVFRIQVPQNATRLEVRLATTGNAQVSFFVRRDSAPSVTNGRVTADYSSPGNTGTETLAIDAQSQPPLTAGTYYIALALFTTNTSVRGSLTATVTAGGGGGTNPPPVTPGSGQVLTSGRPARFTLAPAPSGTLVNGDRGFRIVVPAGARRLDIKLRTDNPAHDIDLLMRRDQDVVVANGRAVADHGSTGDTGNEDLSITPASQPPLAAGTYYIAFGVFMANVTISGTIEATITGDANPPNPPNNPPPTNPPPGNPPAGNQLISGTPRNISIPATSLPTLISGTQAYAINVPQNANRLDIRLATVTANADLDLYVRYGAPPEIQGDRIVADFSSTGPTGNETIGIAPNTNPALRAGVYYIAVAVFTKGVTITGSLTATVATAGGAAPPPPTGGGITLRPGVAQSIQLAAVAQATLVNGARGYLLQVPAGATRLELSLRTMTPNADVDLFVRQNADPVVQNGKVQADFASTGPTGNENIVVTTSSNPPLRAGTYFVAIGVFTPDVAISGTLMATFNGNGGGGAGEPPIPGAPVLLRSGQPYGVALEAVTSSTLFTGSNAYAIDVPDGAVRLEIRLSTQTPGVDVDLFARYNAVIGVTGNRVVADHISDGPTGNESITVTGGSQPRLRPGRYHIGLGLFTTGIPVSATLTATVVTNSPAESAVLARVLTPEAPSKFSLPAQDVPTLFVGEYGYQVRVPEGVRRMKLILDSDVPSIDVDIYARYEEDVNLDGEGGVLTDHSSEGPTGNEVLTIDGNSEPALRPGVYYIGLANFTAGEPATGLLSVEFEREVTTPSLSSARPLTNGVPARFNLPSVPSPTLFTGDRGFRVDVPSSRGTLEILVKSDNPAIDVDVFVRYGSEPEIVENRVAADYRATGDTGDEAVVIHRLSIPALRAGSYFIALGLYTTGSAASGTVTARFVPEDSFAMPEPRAEALVKEQGPRAEGSAIEAKHSWGVEWPLTDAAKRESEPQIRPMSEPAAVKPGLRMRGGLVARP